MRLIILFSLSFLNSCLFFGGSEVSNNNISNDGGNSDIISKDMSSDAVSKQDAKSADLGSKDLSGVDTHLPPDQGSRICDRDDECDSFTMLYDCKGDTYGKMKCKKDCTFDETTCHSNVKKVSAGFNHACLVRADGSAECWGGDEHGEVSELPSKLRFKDISAGAGHSCGLKMDGTVVCWGTYTNDKKEFQMVPPIAKLKSINSGTGHFACGLNSENRTLCWGKQSIWGRKIPNKVFHNLSVGTRHACAISKENKIYCWGIKHDGRVRFTFNDAYYVDAGYNYSCRLDLSGSVGCSGDIAPTLQGNFSEIVSEGDGEKHSPFLCGKTVQNKVFCNGGMSSPTNSFLQIDAGRDFMCGITSDRRVECWSDKMGLQVISDQPK